MAFPLSGMRAPDSPAIPYRTDTSVAAGSLAWAMVAVAAVLGVLALGAVILRHRGLLKQRSTAPRDAARGEGDLRALASRRLSRTTTVHLVEADGMRYLVAESLRPCIVHPVARLPEREVGA